MQKKLSVIDKLTRKGSKLPEPEETTTQAKDGMCKQVTFKNNDGTFDRQEVVTDRS